MKPRALSCALAPSMTESPIAYRPGGMPARAGAAVASRATVSAVASKVLRIHAPYGAKRMGTRRLRRVISLQPLTDDNRAALVGLRIDPSQERFVNNVSEALLEAEEEPGGRAIQFGLYDDETPVGFVMISDAVDGPGYIA